MGWFGAGAKPHAVGVFSFDFVCLELAVGLVFGVAEGQLYGFFFDDSDDYALAVFERRDVAEGQFSTFDGSGVGVAAHQTFFEGIGGRAFPLSSTRRPWPSRLSADEERRTWENIGYERKST